MKRLQGVADGGQGNLVPCPRPDSPIRAFRERTQRLNIRAQGLGFPMHGNVKESCQIPNGLIHTAGMSRRVLSSLHGDDQRQHHH